MTRKLHSVWTRAAKSAADKERLKSLLDVAEPLLTILREALENKYALSVRDDCDFDTPNWAYKNAYNLGYREAMKDMIQMLRNVE